MFSVLLQTVVGGCSPDGDGQGGGSTGEVHEPPGGGHPREHHNSQQVRLKLSSLIPRPCGGRYGYEVTVQVDTIYI